MPSTWKTYGARTLVRLAPVGEPLGVDEHFDPTVTLVELRIVLLRARSFDEAIAKAEAESAAYVAEEHDRNPYGQELAKHALDFVDVYDIGEPEFVVRKPVEVYSSTEVIPSTITDEEIVDRQLGARHEPRGLDARRNIMSILFNVPAPGVELNRRESAFEARFFAWQQRVRAAEPARRTRKKASKRKR